MPSTAKKNTVTNITIVKKFRDYGNDPASKKKAEAAIKFLKKHPLPESFKKKQ